MTRQYMSRRLFLSSTALVPLGAVASTTTAAAAPSPPGASGPWAGDLSENSWPILDRSPEARRVEGTGWDVRLADADVAAVLGYVARRYFYEVSTPAPLGALGSHSTTRKVAAAYESNRLSATAVVIGEHLYPIGATEQVSSSEELVIRDILAECEGTVAWGRDFEPPMDSYFGVCVPRTDPRLAKVARKITRGDQPEFAAAGYPVEVTAPARRTRSRTLRSEQRELRRLDMRGRRYSTRPKGAR